MHTRKRRQRLQGRDGSAEGKTGRCCFRRSQRLGAESAAVGGSDSGWSLVQYQKRPSKVRGAKMEGRAATHGHFANDSSSNSIPTDLSLGKTEETDLFKKYE